MDYYKNADYLSRESKPAIYGISYKVTTDLAEEPVDLDLFKAHAVIDFAVNDSLVEMYLKAARIELENYCQRAFGEKTIKLTALNLPENYSLPYAPIKSITTTGFTLFGDMVKEGGCDIELEYVTEGVINDLIKLAICRYAAGLYAIREHVMVDKNGNPVSGQIIINEAKQMLQGIRVITIC